MRTIDQIENDLDASDEQPKSWESWWIEFGILVAFAMVAALAIRGM